MLNYQEQDKNSGLGLRGNKISPFYDICIIATTAKPNLKDLHLADSSRPGMEECTLK